MLKKNVWEQGSGFHLLQRASTAVANSSPWDDNGLFFGSGREALRAVLEHGQAKRGWKRLWIPSYYCPEVVKAIKLTGIKVAVYSHAPHETVSICIPAAAGDVILKVNLFGLEEAAKISVVGDLAIEVIEDHSHDPWSLWAEQSKADWCIVSLRKTLPIPDGGVLWSPSGHTGLEPCALHQVHKKIALEKLASMALKTLYLAGAPVAKDSFRTLAVSGEEKLASGELSGISRWSLDIMRSVSFTEWRQRRYENYRLLSNALTGMKELTVLKPQGEYPSSCPFFAVLVFTAPERRNQMLENLLMAQIYPAVVWPLDNKVVSGIPPEHIDFSRKMLAVHCDARYSAEDMYKVVQAIAQIALKWAV